MNILLAKITLQSNDKQKFYDLNRLVTELISSNDIKNGLVTIRTLHTTTAVIINENEPCLLKDMQIWLEKLVPSTDTYEHDDMNKRVNCLPDEPKNAQAHLQAALLGHDVSVPVIQGKLSLGQWQSIFFVELDGPRPNRQIEIIIQV